MLVVVPSGLHGTQLSGAAGELTAVMIEPARAAEVAPLIVQAYGLSERERDVTHLVLFGLSTTEIAQRMGISPFTVQDYLKAIFRKVNVHSRQELVARIFVDHYEPRLRQGPRPAASGYFWHPASSY